MFGKKAQPPIKSLIAHGTRIEGNVVFSEGLRIDGEVVGDVRCGDDQSSMLVISEAATVRGEVLADHVIVNGTVHGPVTARELLELQPKARITGRVSYSALEMHQGAVISGELHPLVAAAGDEAKDDEEKPLLKLATKSA